MGLFGILIGFIGAMIGVVTGLFAGAFGLVMGFFGLLLPFAPIVLVVVAIVWLANGSPRPNVLPASRRGEALTEGSGNIPGPKSV